ncbi:MAG: AAA family ATPase [Spirochaetales bacterium]|nr:AAA family ATPase [Spirochaetales bacterium]
MHIENIGIHNEKFPENDVYPFNIEVLQRTSSVALTTPVTFFVGENGSGKSTLLRSIAHRANIHIWKGFERSRFKKSRYEDELYRYISLVWSNGLVHGSFFASEIFRNFSQLLDEWASADPGVLKYFGNQSLMTKSHGQSHMAFFKHRFGIKGLYLLDEPENALSPKTQLQLLEILKSTRDAQNAQFIIATHSPILLSLDGGRILSFDKAPLADVEFHQTEQFRVYKDFFELYKNIELSEVPR